MVWEGVAHTNLFYSAKAHYIHVIVLSIIRELKLHRIWSGETKKKQLNPSWAYYMYTYTVQVSTLASPHCHPLPLLNCINMPKIM